jgi:hypothetical protein
MSLDLIKKLVNDKKNNPARPNWVSDTNITVRVFELINKLKVERLQYIQNHNSKADYQKKKLYRITVSEIASTLDVASSTLTAKSKYAPGLKAYLENVNQELEDAKEKKLETHRRTLSAGTNKRKKDELVSELQNARGELEKLKKRNALDQATNVLKALPLPIKRTLGLNV